MYRYNLHNNGSCQLADVAAASATTCRIAEGLCTTIKGSCKSYLLSACPCRRLVRHGMLPPNRRRRAHASSPCRRPGAV